MELGERNYDQLFAGSNVLPVTKHAVIASGNTVVRGQVLGRITSGGKLKHYQSGSSDGSEVPFAIAAEDVDASTGDVETIYYATGEFNKNALVFDGGDTLTTAVEDTLRDLNIHVKGTVDVEGVHHE